MRAMVLRRIVSLSQVREPLELADMPRPTPRAGELLIQSRRLWRLPHGARRNRRPNRSATASRHPGSRSRGSRGASGR